MYRLTCIVLVASNCTALFGQTTNFAATGGPGDDAHWESGAKDGFGTANTLLSRVWFTLADGIMTEVFYPTLDVPNVQSLQLLIVTEGQLETEKENTIHQIQQVGQSLTFRQINTSRDGDYSITKTYVTDPAADTVLIDIQFQTRSNSDVYLNFDPSLNNSGRHDTAWVKGDALFAKDGNIATAVVSDCGIGAGHVSNGFLGVNDGLVDLRKQQHLTGYVRAENGNVVQTARLDRLSRKQNQTARCTIALGFGPTEDTAQGHARRSLRKGFSCTRSEYEQGWRRYLSALPRVEDRYQAQLNTSAMVLKALEDKTYRGAMIASPSNPWGAGPNANEAKTTGYHAVWSRDLYHVATAFLALGDRSSANRALEYLLGIQQLANGSFPQNSHVNGKAIGTAVQMDQVAYPLILAYQLEKHDRDSWFTHLKPAAEYIIRHGPTTEQERWEEERGYSPATIAAEIAALVCAAELARRHGDVESARTYLKVADEWKNSVERWTVTSTSRYGKHFLRISENNDPDDGAKIEINSGGGHHDEREIVDTGFLELVRLGIKSPHDSNVRRSLTIVDRMIRFETTQGSAWYRYNEDRYGERDDGGPYDGKTGKGRPWPLLTGERGEYELASGDVATARRHLDAMLAFANEGGMIPEQIWDLETQQKLRLGEGTGSATPLAWSMAQFVRLAINVKYGRNLETPRVVAQRYLGQP